MIDKTSRKSGCREIPFVRNHDDELFLDVHVAGRRLRLALDIGASHSVFDRAVLEACAGKDVHELSSVVVQASGGDTTALAGPFPGVTFIARDGGEIRHDFQMAVFMDLSPMLRSAPEERWIDGVIGNDFLRGCKIDFGGNVIYLPSEEGVYLLAEELESGGYASIPIERVGGGVLKVTGTIGGKPVNISVDSGAGESSLDAESARTLGLRLRELKEDARMGADGIPLKTSETVIEGLSIGTVRLDVGRILVMPHNPSVLELYCSKGSDLVFWLGRDLLKKHSAIVDLENGVLYLKESV